MPKCGHKAGGSQLSQILRTGSIDLDHLWVPSSPSCMKQLLRYAFSSASLLAVSATACGPAQPAQGPEVESASHPAAEAAPAAPTKPQAVNAGSCPKDGLIDDFEDGNHQAQLSDTRGGYWYTYKDPSSSVAPEGTFTSSQGGQASAFSGRMSGTVGAQQYPYVGMGVTMTEPKQAYDVSCCEGVSFWGKKSGDGIANIRFKVGDWQTDPAGGSCKDCYNDFGGDFTFTDEWQEFSIKFAEMKQEPYWGEAKSTIDASAIYRLQWQVKENNRPFDIQVDNVRLMGCGGAQIAGPLAQ